MIFLIAGLIVLEMGDNMQSMLEKSGGNLTPVMRHPFTAMICGASNSGKSTLVKNILQKRNYLIRGVNEFRRIYIVYRVWQSSYNELSKDFNNVPVSLIKDEFPMYLLYKKPEIFRDTVIIFEDGACGCNMSDIYELFTKHSHHDRISIFFLCHSVFDPKTPILRLLQRNCHYLFLFKCPRDHTQIRNLAYQISPDKKGAKALIKAFEEETLKGHSYMMFDFTQHCPQEVRFKADVLCEHSPFPIVRTLPEYVSTT